MTESIVLGDVCIAVTRKAVKNVHLSVHPPLGRVTLVAPRPPAWRWPVPTPSPSWAGYGSSKPNCWRRRARPRASTSRGRRTPCGGRPYLLAVTTLDAKPAVVHDQRRITLTVRPGSTLAQRQAVMDAWHRTLLHQALPALIAQWAMRLGVQVRGYFLQRMKTKWGACNHRAGNIRLNNELAKKPKDVLEYVVVHEMLHLLEPHPQRRFCGPDGAALPHMARGARGVEWIALGGANLEVTVRT